ncbi:hypothetical protein [Geodermatophilus ruber]|uniref:Peptidase propeptide and YPEB domain-containing protein n=1 Tax=Geodermatophilus ruber TaxID=504800 RepID=A0A1I4J3N3_9ACTN|nr:hypothetical protein [Geodermatophilus ruber]SFL61159.1 hypothetical protein SAMN04488085_11438 [Geodermatophilus ruber]
MPGDVQQRTRGRARSTALVGAGVLAGAVIAGTLVVNAATDDFRDRSPVTQGDARDHRDGGRAHEQPLTGATAERVTDAALAEYPGATVRRVESDSDGAYEAHLVTRGGERVTVEVGENFTVTGIEPQHR